MANSDAPQRRNAAASLAPAPSSVSTAHQGTLFVPKLPTAGSEGIFIEIPADSRSMGPSPIPSSVRGPTHLSNSQHRSNSFPTSGTSQQNGARNSVLPDFRTRTLNASAAASSSMEQKRKTLLDNIMSQLQRMDLVKARTGSVLSRGFILKTDFYPSGKQTWTSPT